MGEIKNIAKYRQFAPHANLKHNMPSHWSVENQSQLHVRKRQQLPVVILR